MVPRRSAGDPCESMQKLLEQIVIVAKVLFALLGGPVAVLILDEFVVALLRLLPVTGPDPIE